MCSQRHPNVANTHPESYRKFQKQLGRLAGGRRAHLAGDGHSSGKMRSAPTCPKRM